MKRSLTETLRCVLCCTFAMLLVGRLSAAVLYVNVNSTNPAAPYTTWSTAATNIQAAVDVSTNGDEIVVTNGIYQTGTRIVRSARHRIAVTKPVTIRSVNGPAVTVIRGFQEPGSKVGPNAVRCAYLTNGTALIGFTLTNGATSSGNPTDSGGGAWCESTNAILSNCVVIANAAYAYGGGVWSGTLNNCTLSTNSPQSSGGGAFSSILNNCTLSGNVAGSYGGGAYMCTLNNCILIGNFAGFSGGGARASTLNNCVLNGNSAGDNGGGAINCTLNNCTIVGNSASSSGGGTSYSTVFNCIVYYNSAPQFTNNLASQLYSSCSLPVPDGQDCFTNAPLFADYAGGNFRLQSNSPCINSGRNANAGIYSGGPLGIDLQSSGAPLGPDVDGNLRIVGGSVDMGAYEYQSPASIISYAWLQQYGMPFDGSIDHADLDMDGFDNWQESRALTSPTNASSFLKVESVHPSGAGGLMVTWEAQRGVLYFIERSMDLGQNDSFIKVAAAYVDQNAAVGAEDKAAIGAGPFFYRIRVE